MAAMTKPINAKAENSIKIPQKELRTAFLNFLVSALIANKNIRDGGHNVNKSH